MTSTTTTTGSHTADPRTVDLDRAAEFVWREARLLDRRRFGHTFVAPDPDGVAAAVLAYRNPDGGFGHLEPDCRTPHSQPEATRFALATLAEVDRLDDEIAAPTVAWLETVSTPAGALPFCLPSVEGFPRAPWWQPGDGAANLNPTAALVGLLRTAGADSSWVRRAERWCFDEVDRRIAAGTAPDQYEVACLGALVAHATDTDRAETASRWVVDHLGGGGVVPLDEPEVEGEADVHTPIEVAPTPGHVWRAAFDDATIERSLDHLVASQADDGGWPIGWRPPSDAAVLEWRGARTVDALRVLAANGRLRS
ncbi:MAG: hypothetical protein S0880_21015 [Actinomycetota bacterium]|nr:hypothetical protein [Actinomycetota bacterium]